ncbi:MAG: cyclic nucleotide-binding domain-containing protein [Chloroflexi bacterium]|nr:cyclic nucleotide-binding domain-containing protein [Chloroflexota bacterium]
MQDLDKRIRFLQTVPMFKGLDERQLHRLARRFTERSFATGEAIVSQGALGIGLFIIETGRAEAVRENVNGEKMVVNQLGPTEFFGELSLLDEAPRTASVIAVEPTTCLVLTQLDFMSVLREDADIPIALLKVLARRFRTAMEGMQ